MHRHKRERTIIDLLKRSGNLAIPDIVGSFQSPAASVSESTIRRDLRELSRRGLLLVDRGAVSLIEHAETPAPPDAFHLEKQAIGQAAAGLVGDGETLLLDSGTTLLEFARALDPSLHLTCITNSLAVAMALAEKPRVETIVIGGSLNRRDRAVSGTAALAALRRFHAGKVFLGTAGISSAMGITNMNLDLVEVRREMTAVADETIVLADTGKFEKTGLATVISLERVGRLVTGSGLVARHRDMLSAYSLELVLA